MDADILRERRTMKKVGEKVRLRTDLDCNKRYRMHGSNNSVAMSKTIINFLQGEELTISDVTDIGYFCEETGKDIVFVDEMFDEGVGTLSIAIHRNGRKVIAENLETGDIGIATCNPSDEFNPEYGAIIAIHRMFGDNSSLVIVKGEETYGD